MSAGASAVAASNDERRAARRRAALAVIVLLALVGALVLAAPAHASLPRLETIARPELGDALSVERLDDLTDDVGSLDAAPDVPDPPLPLLEPLPRTDYGELFARELVLVGDLVQASAQASVSAYDGIASLPETRVWASSVFAPDSRPGFNRVSAETATGFGLGLAGDRVGRTHEGAWTDPVTGLAYHRARWYDPRTASWLSEDPMEDWDSVNRYAFVGLQPHRAVDPLGLAAVDPAKPEWHHLIPDNARVRKILEGAGIDRDAANLGVLVEAGAHRLSTSGKFFQGVDNLHGAGWSRDVEFLLVRLQREGKLSAAVVEHEVKALAGSAKYSKFFEYAIDAPMPHGAWSDLSTPNKWKGYYEPLRERLIQRLAKVVETHPEALGKIASTIAAKKAATGGLRRAGKALGLGFGLGLSYMSFAANAEEMGTSGALTNEALDNIPGLGLGKLLMETVSGDAWIKPESHYELVRSRLKLLELSTGESWQYKGFGYSVTTGYGFVGSVNGVPRVVTEENFGNFMKELQ